MEATVILSKCTKSNGIYGVRIQKMEDRDWWRTWAFPIDEKRAEKEGYDKEQVRGHLHCTEEFPGCPYCGTRSFVQCEECKKLVCWNDEKTMRCPWCKNRISDIIVTTKKFSVSGRDV